MLPGSTHSVRMRWTTCPDWWLLCKVRTGAVGDANCAEENMAANDHGQFDSGSLAVVPWSQGMKCRLNKAAKWLAAKVTKPSRMRRGVLCLTRRLACVTYIYIYQINRIIDE